MSIKNYFMNCLCLHRHYILDHDVAKSFTTCKSAVATKADNLKYLCIVQKMIRLDIL